MSNSLKLSQRKAREQSVSSYVVRFKELQLNQSNLSTRSIEHSVETNLLDTVPNTLKECRHADLPVWVVRPIEERWLARTTFHVAYADFEPIREVKSLTGFDTNCRTGAATRGG